MAKAAKPAPAPKAKKTAQQHAEDAELQFIYSGYDPLNGLVQATSTAVYHRRKCLVIKCDSADMVQKVFKECVADSQRF